MATIYDLNHQTVKIPNTERPGQTAAYKRYTVNNVNDRDDSDVTTCYENLVYSAKKYADLPLLGHRVYDPIKREHGPYVWETFGETFTRVEAVGSGLIQLCEEVGAFERPSIVKTNQFGLGLYSANRPEWVIGELAGHRHRLFSVALYDTLGPDAIEFILNHAEVTVLALSADKIPNILKLRDRLPLLRALISMDPLDTYADMNPPPTALGPLPGIMPLGGEVLRNWAAEKGIKIVDIGELERLGKENPRPANPPSADDLSTICYTSGTTGNPKGAMLTHQNSTSVVCVPVSVLGDCSGDRHISYLPLAHIFERLVVHFMIHQGASIGFSRGDTTLLLEDLAVLKPTVFITVPRLLNRIYDKLIGATVNASGVVGALARRAVASKLENLHQGKGVEHFFWDRLLFNKIKQVLGGQVRLVLTGSAPISGEVLSFLRIAFSCTILEGYGQTESSGGTTTTLDNEYRIGHVGSPLMCNSIKLVDVPEMNYLSTDKPLPRGEICVQGPNVFVGYLKDEEKTREALDEEGWLHSGDIGQINEDGTITIIDRKKNIFKLAQGEYVAPEKIENIYITHPAIAQIYVHGDSLQSKLVAIVVPDPETFPQWASKQLDRTITLEDLPKVCDDPTLRAKLLDDLTIFGRKAGLNGFELAYNLRLKAEAFSVENDLLTPTLKMKRMQVRDRYRADIDEMYAELASNINVATTPAKL